MDLKKGRSYLGPDSLDSHPESFNPQTPSLPPQIPIIGNGDILAHHEAADRAARGGAAALMVGRGALIKPWVFQEYKEVCGAVGARSGAAAR